MKTALPVLVILLVPMCIVGLIATILLRRSLKREHPEVHLRLSASPVQMANDLSFTRFLLSGAYVECVGPDMKKKMDALRISMIVYVGVFGATVLGLAFS